MINFKMLHFFNVYIFPRGGFMIARLRLMYYANFTWADKFIYS